MGEGEKNSLLRERRLWAKEGGGCVWRRAGGWEVDHAESSDSDGHVWSWDLAVVGWGVYVRVLLRHRTCVCTYKEIYFKELADVIVGD